MPLTHSVFTRRNILTVAAAATAGMALGTAARAQPKIDRLVLAGPFASVSNPLIRIVESGALDDVADEVEFAQWKDPDQLRALALGDSADFMAMPSNVAANLFNRGVKLKLLDITTWGILFVVSRDAAMKTLDDLKGKELVVPFRGDMLDILLQTVAEQLGIKIGEDVKVRYVATPMEALQLLLTRRADQALLAEPAVSMGLLKARSLPAKIIAPDLYRSIDLQQEWARAFDRAPRIPQAGVVVMGRRLGDAALIERFSRAHAEALDWCQGNADTCGRIVADEIDMLSAEAVADSVRAVKAKYVPAPEARPELEFLFKQLHQRQPGLIGGKLPPDDFYYGA